MPKEKSGKTVKTRATTNGDKPGDKKIKKPNKPKSNSLEQAILNTEMQILVAKDFSWLERANTHCLVV